MQSFNTNNDDAARPANADGRLTIGATADLLSVTRFELPNGDELAIYNIDSEFYAIENSCPHKGAPLAEGTVCGHLVECGWHGWQFDVRTGECLTVRERIKTYRLSVEDGLLKIEVSGSVGSASEK